jgi:fructose-bisphosphate aldolase, class I
MANNDLGSIARGLAAEGKGILAADESFGTIEKRFKTIDLPTTEENRRAYRDMLFTTPGFGDFISGVILFDETLRQKSADGTPFAELLRNVGSIPGIKVDAGAKPLAKFPNEKITEGLDGLRDRLSEYVKLGAQFTKWRAVITIGDGIPSRGCIEANAEALARYAALAQEAGLVPIVEPEVLMDGDHSIERCEEVTELTLNVVFDRLYAHRVTLEHMLLKPNMVIAGKNAARRADVDEVARATVRTLLRTVPPAVPGVVFLSGGQTPEEATAHLNVMNQLGDLPWELSYSYGRALQEEALTTWRGQQGNVDAAQKAFTKRGRCVSAARYGKYSTDMEKAA